MPLLRLVFSPVPGARGYRLSVFEASRGRTAGPRARLAAMLMVWGRINSINVQKVLWTLAELRLEYRRIDAGMKFGVNDTAEYKARNPTGLIPTIDDDGLVLWESNVIVRYLAAKH